MSEQEILLDALRERYKQAAGAMRLGVEALSRSVPGQSAITSHADVDSKGLRVGVNSNMVECQAILKILMAKGIVTEEEYLTALAESMEAEVHRYDEVLSQRRGYRVNLLRGDGV